MFFSFERFIFYTRDRKGEKFALLFTDLKKLSFSSKFKEQTTDKLICDTIVLGINDNDLQRKLLEKQKLILIKQ